MKTIARQIVELADVIDRMNSHIFELKFESYPLGVSPPRDSIEAIYIRRMEKALIINHKRLAKLINLKKSGFIW